MYCRAFACDFDGTGASNGRLAPEIAAVLAAARARGYATLLVTGRVLEELRAADVDFGAFDAVVAENGAVVWLPAMDRNIQIGEPPPDGFLAELRSIRVPYHAGAVVVGTWDRHATEVLALVRRFGMASQLVFNREAMMVLPSGVDKAVGVRRALEELHRSARNMIAFGDAENDRPLLDTAEIGIAARGSVASIAAAADDRLSQPGAAGVAHYIQSILDRSGHVATPPRHRIHLGTDDRGSPVYLPAAGANVMISGDPRSGKSWLAGLVAERLIERGYRVCIIDPEGDYPPLGQRPQVLTLGAELSLPDPTALPNVLRDEPISLILNLAALSQLEKQRYVEAAVPCLEAARATSGLPHWILIDEVHYFLNERAMRAYRFDGRTGGYIFVTYRPSLVASDIHTGVKAHIVMETTVEEERYFLTGLLQARDSNHVPAADVLAPVRGRKAGLLLENAPTSSWQVFTPGARAITQVHHGRKYADALLPEDKAFRFLQANGAGATAHSVAEFCAALESVPATSLRHHLLQGDFSRWAAGVLGDSGLAAAFHKLEETTRVGAPPSRDELLAHVRDLYVVGNQLKQPKGAHSP
jgi:hydroxymethylpyrimidine pyrophosphatase-like HAD family hydrolase